MRLQLPRRFKSLTDVVIELEACKECEPRCLIQAQTLETPHQGKTSVIKGCGYV